MMMVDTDDDTLALALDAVSKLTAALARTRTGITAPVMGPGSASAPPAATPDTMEDPRRVARGSTPPPAPGFFVGDAGPTQELMQVVLNLVSTRPFALQELVRTTGARRNRISGAIARMQRAGAPIVNVGNGRIARWHLPQGD